MEQAIWQETTVLPRGSSLTPPELWELIFSNSNLEHTQQAAKVLAGTNTTMKSAACQELAATHGSDPVVLRGLMDDAFDTRPRSDTVRKLLTATLERSAWKIAFTNLVSGRFTELVFDTVYRSRLKVLGLKLIEETQQRSFLDFRIEGTDNFDLAINLKNAGMQMRQAEQFFGLAPEDTIPMATYKAFGAYEALTNQGIPLLYVFLVDWDMLGRLRSTYWDSLEADERLLFQLIATTKKMPRDLEDAFIEDTVGGKLTELMRACGYSSGSSLPFRVVSAGKCARIFYTEHHRSPYVYIRRMQTDPNVHISVKDETISFDDLMTTHLVDKPSRDDLLRDLQNTSEVVRVSLTRSNVLINVSPLRSLRQPPYDPDTAAVAGIRRLLVARRQ
jgi:hypothetical protein